MSAVAAVLLAVNPLRDEFSGKLLVRKGQYVNLGVDWRIILSHIRGFVTNNNGFWI
jgi:hypothetical protein